MKKFFGALSVAGAVALGYGMISFSIAQPSPGPEVSPSPEASPSEPIPQPTFATVAADPKYCEHLVDAEGHPLYLFDKDTETESKCTEACATDWPPALSPDLQPPATVPGAKPELASTPPIPRADGTLQSIYGGHPLYTYKKDVNPGQIEGHCAPAFEGKWYLVSPEGTACSCEVAPSPTPAPPPPAPPVVYVPPTPYYPPTYTPPSSRFPPYCGTNYVCGWTKGYRCYDPFPYLSQCLPECCEYVNDFSCPGNNSCGGGGGYTPPYDPGYGGGECTTETVCGWTPGWRCKVPFGGCDPFDKNCLKRCGCDDYKDPSCPGFS